MSGAGEIPREGRRYNVPAGDPGTVCKGCGDHIWFVQTEYGRKMPVNWDGMPHWATCPNRDDFKRWPRRKMDEN